MTSHGVLRSPCANIKCRNLVDISCLGWKRLGHEVALCHKCYIAYMRKQFCYIYHKDSTTWNFCKFCNKKIHLLCEVSQDWYVILEDGGIECNQCSPSVTSLLRSSQETVPNNLINDDENLLESQLSSPPPLALEYNTNQSSVKAQAHSRNEKQHSEKDKKDELHRYTPKMTDEELKEIVKGFNDEVTPLFEKKLSGSDTGKGGRLVVPKKCAERFFPRTDDAKGQPIKIQDSKGKDWAFNFRMWPNNNSRMYVLEGFESYVKSMKLAEGDTVTFSKLEPEGKLVIGNRKVSSLEQKGKKDKAPSAMHSKGKKQNDSIIVQASSRNTENVNLDTEPSEPTEAQVIPTQNAVTLSVPLKWVKTQPRHRSGCWCKLCMQPLSCNTSSTNIPITSPSRDTTDLSRSTEPQNSVLGKTFIANRSSNIEDKVMINEDSGNHQNVNELPSDSSVPPFDLNLSPEPDEE